MFPWCFRWPVGKQIVQCLSSKVTTFLNFTYSGARFVFGYLADGSGIFNSGAFRPKDNSTEAEGIRGILSDINTMGVVGTPFFFGPLSIIYFVSFFVSMLFYWGTLQFIVQKMGESNYTHHQSATQCVIMSRLAAVCDCWYHSS